MAWFKRDGTKDVIRVNNNDTSTDRKFKGVYAAWIHAIGFDVDSEMGGYKNPEMGVKVRDTDRYFFPLYVWHRDRDERDFDRSLGFIDIGKDILNDNIDNWNVDFDESILNDNADSNDKDYVKNLKKCVLLCDLTEDAVHGELCCLVGIYRDGFDLDSNLGKFSKRVDTILTQLSDLQKDNTLSVDEKLDCLMVAAYELRVDTGEIDIRDKRKREFFSEYTDKILSKESDFFHISENNGAIIFDGDTLYFGSPDGIVEYHNLGSITDGENRMLEKCFEKGYSGEEAFDVNNIFYFPFVYNIIHDSDLRENYLIEPNDFDFEKIGKNLSGGVDSGLFIDVLNGCEDSRNVFVDDFYVDSYLNYCDVVKHKAREFTDNEFEFNELYNCINYLPISELMLDFMSLRHVDNKVLESYISDDRYHKYLYYDKVVTLDCCGVDTGKLLVSRVDDNSNLVDDIMVKLSGVTRLDGRDFSYFNDGGLNVSKSASDFIKYFTNTKDGKERVEKFNKEYGADWVNRQLKVLSEKDNPIKDVDDYIRGLDDFDKGTVKDFED